MSAAGRLPFAGADLVIAFSSLLTLLVAGLVALVVVVFAALSALALLPAPAPLLARLR
jgi:hypothetical protein